MPATAHGADATNHPIAGCVGVGGGVDGGGGLVGGGDGCVRARADDRLNVEEHVAARGGQASRSASSVAVAFPVTSNCCGEDAASVTSVPVGIETV